MHSPRRVLIRVPCSSLDKCRGCNKQLAFRKTMRERERGTHGCEGDEEEEGGGTRKPIFCFVMGLREEESERERETASKSYLHVCSGVVERETCGRGFLRSCERKKPSAFAGLRWKARAKQTEREATPALLAKLPLRTGEMAR